MAAFAPLILTVRSSPKRERLSPAKTQGFRAIANPIINMIYSYKIKPIPKNLLLFEAGSREDTKIFIGNSELRV